MSYTTPNMSLLGISIGVDSGITIENNYNANMNLLDQHNHSAGSGVQIQPSGINLSSDLPFNSNSATNLRTCRFVAQTSPITGASPDLGCVYVSGVDLWYNDVSGNQVQMTSGGSVLATSSGISSGTASASFSAGVLVVLAAANTPANIKGGSLLIGNNVANTKYLTLAPPSSMAANFSLTLPALPSAQSFMTIDTSGNITGYANISGGLLGSNLANQTVTATQILNNTITATQIANGTITGTQIGTSINLAGTAVQEGGKNVVVSNTNTTKSLAVIRGIVGTGGTVQTGEGWTVSLSAGTYTVAFTSALTDVPAVTICAADGVYNGHLVSASASGFSCYFVTTPEPTTNTDAVVVNTSFHFIAVGQRV